jgi:hypothetical protein
MTTLFSKIANDDAIRIDQLNHAFTMATKCGHQKLARNIQLEIEYRKKLIEDFLKQSSDA